MARKAKEANEREADEKESPETLPEGFQPIDVSGDQAWFKPTEGSVVVGELIGRIMRKKANRDGKKGWFYQIRLDNSPTAFKGSKKRGTREEVHLEPGEVINVDERSALENLAQYVGQDKRFTVFIRYIEKIDLEDGNTFWRTAVGVKERKQGDEGVPF